ncbi:MAG: GntR family transcriptional regulator [Balneolaceae bacterium]|nr:GntR family transcriptional regulator [Balneolaceae bacterium]
MNSKKESATINLSELKPGLPLHEQISHWIETKIDEGMYESDQKLPSEYQLSEMFNVSRVTVRRALQTLESSRLIYRCQGLGSFVGKGKTRQPLVRLTDFMEDMHRAGMQAKSTVLSMGVVDASAAVAEQLGVTEGQKVFQLNRQRLGDDTPLAMDETWLPFAYGQLIEKVDLGNRTIFAILEEDYEIPVMRGCYQITSTTATKDLARCLDTEEGAALLLLHRIAYTVGDKPIFYQKRYYKSDAFAYEMRLDRVEPNGQGAAQPFDEAPIREIVPVFYNKQP